MMEIFHSILAVMLPFSQPSGALESSAEPAISLGEKYILDVMSVMLKGCSR